MRVEDDIAREIRLILVRQAKKTRITTSIKFIIYPTIDSLTCTAPPIRSSELPSWADGSETGVCVRVWDPRPGSGEPATDSWVFI